MVEAGYAYGPMLVTRRPAGGAPGSPSNMLSGQIAFNEADRTFYYGWGDNGEGMATTPIAIGGDGAFATKQFVTDAMAGSGAGDMLKSIYDTNDDGKVDAANTADSVQWSGVQGKPASFPPSAHPHDEATTDAAGFMSKADKLKLNGLSNYAHPTGDGNRHVPATSAGDVNKFLKSGPTAGSAPSFAAVSKADVGLSQADNTPDLAKPISEPTQTALDLKAPLAAPTFTGIPRAPTPATSTSTTQIATTAYVKAVVDALLNGVGTSFDTLKELADALGNDPNFAATVTAQVAGKLAKASNLGDLPDPEAARTNLQLGSMATQSANNVNITGGTISGFIFDGGTF